MSVKVLVCYSDECESMCYVILMSVKVLVCYSDECECIGYIIQMIWESIGMLF